MKKRKKQIHKKRVIHFTDGRKQVLNAFRNGIFPTLSRKIKRNSVMYYGQTEPG